ncbi:MAG: indolepyruvate oxidoreductase subunit beta [Oscillospiraceae bacterium]|jgi:indolepyruvate ferredoxin oxidoreductase beta subunit|nr:indolepyruvate oxidoreductase subunit beta [Oscillospiraceae bacterium]
MLNLIITGVGGQGTVLLSRLIGQAALDKGFDIRGSETIGMAQRGGSVVSHVRIGADILSPLIPPRGAGLIIAFEPGEAVRALPFLATRGAMVVFDRPVNAVTSALGGGAYDAAAMLTYLRARVGRLTVVDGARTIAACGGAKAINVALLGVAAAGGLLPFDRAEAERALRARIPARLLDINLRALDFGAALAAEAPRERDGP